MHEFHWPRSELCDLLTVRYAAPRSTDHSPKSSTHLKSEIWKLNCQNNGISRDIRFLSKDKIQPPNWDGSCRSYPDRPVPGSTTYSPHLISPRQSSRQPTHKENIKFSDILYKFVHEFFFIYFLFSVCFEIVHCSIN